MSTESKIRVTNNEREIIKEALDREFGSRRITIGAYCRLLAEERLNELASEDLEYLLHH